MAEINLHEKSQSAHQDYDPIVLSENVKIEASRDIIGSSYAVEGTIEIGGKKNGRFVFNENQGRLFVNCPLDDLKRNTRREIIETVASLILTLVPEAVDTPVEEAAV